MGVGQTAAAGVHGEVSAGSGALVRHEVGTLAGFAVAKALKGCQHRVGEGVVNHGEVDVVMGYAGHLQGCGTGVARPCARKVLHLADNAVVVAFRRSEDVNGRLRQVARALRSGNDIRSSRVRYQTAVGKVEGPGNPARVVVVVKGHGSVLEVCLGVEVRPLAGGDGDFCHALSHPALAVHVHVAAGSHRVVDGRADESVRRLVLGACVRGVAARAGTGAAACFAVRYEHGVAVASVDGGDGVRDVDDERRAADSGRIGVCRVDAQVFAEVDG